MVHGNLYYPIIPGYRNVLLHDTNWHQHQVLLKPYKHSNTGLHIKPVNYKPRHEMETNVIG
jgi:hypothetical protein